LLERFRQWRQVRLFARWAALAYDQWLRRYRRFHGLRNHGEMGEAEIDAFLKHMATVNQVGATIQDQGLSALLFLYREVLGSDIGSLKGGRQSPPIKATACGDDGGGSASCAWA
jgi:hypothetical protein